MILHVQLQAGRLQWVLKTRYLTQTRLLDTHMTFHVGVRWEEFFSSVKLLENVTTASTILQMAEISITGELSL